MGHLWDVACQRRHVPTANDYLQLGNGTNFFFDIDYYVAEEGIMLRVSFPYSQELKRFWMGVGIPGSLDTSSEFYLDGYNIYPLKFDHNLCFYSFSGSITSLTYNISIIGNLNQTFSEANINSTSNFFFNYDLNVTEYYNRSECYDLYNMRFYAQLRNRHHIIDIITLDSLMLMFYIMTLLLFLVVSNGKLVRRRFYTSVLSQVFVIITFSIQTIPSSSYLISKMLYTIRHPNNSALDLSQKILASLSLHFALVLYCYKVFRFFQLKYIYQLKFRSNKVLNKLEKFTFTRFGYLMLFLIGIVTVAVFVVALVVSIFSIKKALTTYNIRDILFWVDISFLLFVICVYLVEMLANWKILIKKGIVNFFFVDDPMLYRLEICFMLITMVTYMCYEKVPFTAFDSYFTTVIVMQLFYYIVIYGYQFSFGSGILLCIELYWLFKGLFTKANETLKEPQLARLLADSKFRLAFEEYCLKEYSIENLVVYNKLDRLKHSNGLSRAAYEELYNTYLSSHAELQINMSSYATKLCVQLLQLPDNVKKITFQDLKPLYDEVVLNLAETFTRFSNTMEYSKYMEMKKVMKREFLFELSEPLL
jgi:hypothetical protein